MREEENPLAQAPDRIVWEYLKRCDEAAWQLAWARAVKPEITSFRSAARARDWGVSAEDLMSELYLTMIAEEKINLYRGEGSLWGWLRTYVRGFIAQAKPNTRMISIEAQDEAYESEAGSFLEKISQDLSDSSSSTTKQTGVSEIQRREEWQFVQRCFADLFKRNPLRAYVHWLKLRMNFSSLEIKNMLAMSSTANVDQVFKRALGDMKKLKVQHEERL